MSCTESKKVGTLLKFRRELVLSIAWLKLWALNGIQRYEQIPNTVNKEIHLGVFYFKCLFYNERNAMYSAPKYKLQMRPHAKGRIEGRLS